MEALGVKMALQASGKPINDKLKAEQTSATKDLRKAATTSAATAGADAAAHQTIDACALDWIQTAALWLGLAALLGVAIYFAWRAFEHRQRANAYADVMAGKTGG